MQCTQCAKKLTFNLKFQIPYRCSHCAQKYSQKDTSFLVLFWIFYPIVVSTIISEFRTSFSGTAWLFISMMITTFMFKLMQVYCLRYDLYEPIIPDDIQ